MNLHELKAADTMNSRARLYKVAMRILRQGSFRAAHGEAETPR